MIEQGIGIQGKEDTVRSQTWPSRSSQPSRGLEGTTDNPGQPVVRTQGRLRLCTVAAQEDTTPTEQCSGGNPQPPEKA